MTSWKTTLAGFVAAAAHMAPSFGHMGSVDINTAISGMALLFMGWYSKDKGTTGVQ